MAELVARLYELEALGKALALDDPYAYDLDYLRSEWKAMIRNIDNILIGGG